MLKRYPSLQNGFLIVIGFILSILIIEGTLRLSSLIMLEMQEYRNLLSIKRKGNYTIMCLGESTTADAAGHSPYPRQLEKILNQKNIGIDFTVINKGVIGTNTRNILKRLEENINDYKPDMIITMMGINDKTSLLSPFVSIPGKEGLIRSSRTYKVIRLILLHFSFLKTRNNENSSKKESLNNEKKKKKKPFIHNPESRAIKRYKKAALLSKYSGNYEKSTKHLKDLLKVLPGNSWAHLMIGQNYAYLHDSKNAEKHLLKSIEINNKNSAAYCELACVYYYKQNKKDKAENAIKKAIIYSPDTIFYYTLMFHILNSQNKQSDIEPFIIKALKRNPKSDILAGLLAHFYLKQNKAKLANKYFSLSDRIRNQFFNPVTFKYYNKIKNFISSKDITMVAVQYPALGIEPLKKLLGYDKDVIFVDNELVFKEAIMKAPVNTYFTDLFGGVFGHCSERGNHLLAENISNTIINKIYLKSNHSK